MTYRSNQEFKDSQKKGVPELIIYLDTINKWGKLLKGAKHCTINDDEDSSQLINTIINSYPNKIIRVEKGVRNEIHKRTNNCEINDMKGGENR